jgi:hypothetical protein
MRALDLSSEQLAHQARACSVLTTAQALAEWVGRGRPVTARGVLKPAFVVEACDLLGIEMPSRKPRSALDVAELMMVWTAAAAAGFIEVSRERVTAGPALRPWLDGDPDAVLAIWSKCALASIGMLGETKEGDLTYLAVLVTLDDRGGVVSLGDLDAGVGQLVGDDLSDCSCPDCASLETEDAVEALGEFGIAVLTDGTAELTPLGRWLTDFMFRQSAPPADTDAEFVVRQLARLPDIAVTVMARPWLASRAPATAAQALLAVGERTSGPERLTAVMLAGECGAEAEPVWREWAAKDGFGAYARGWLAEHDDVEPSDADLAWITVDGLVTILDALPADLPESVQSFLLLAQSADELPEVLPLLAGCNHPAAPRLAKLLAGGMSPMVEPFEQAPVPSQAPPRRQVRAKAVYQIKVQLLGVTKPPVWRRLQVPADLSLDQLHDVIQAAMGWYDCHLHMFSDGSREYGIPDLELGYLDERKVYLSQVVADVGDKLRYTYDFGDNWDHDVTLEKILPDSAELTGSFCTAGKGACPPEDCGGVWGYEELKAKLADPDAEDHEDLLEWLGLASGDDFDAKEFSTEEVNQRIGRSA